jgi:hypothetical protein
MKTPYIIMLIIIYVFLLWSAFYAIITALNRLKSQKGQQQEAASALEAWRFKWSAPAGLVYGLLVFVLIFLSIKYEYAEHLKGQVDILNSRIAALESENQYLRTLNSDSTSGRSFTTVFKYSGTVPVLGGRVLLSYSSSTFKFDGAIGLAESPSGPFRAIEVPYQVPQKVYVKIDSTSVWGVNIYKDESNQVVFQFYRIGAGS